jgi:molybdenum cofactor synthesis domain-containing protein
MSKSSTEREFVALNIAVLTVSDSRTEDTDKSGKLLAGRLTDAGHRLAAKRIVPDDVYTIRAVVAGWIADRDVDVVITTGGTGVTGRDGTPEAVGPLLDKTIDGLRPGFDGRLRHGLGRTAQRPARHAHPALQSRRTDAATARDLTAGARR